MAVVLDRPPRTDDELWWLTQALWSHKIPRQKVCPHHDPPFEAFATAYFNREPQILIHGSRGLSGKSRLLSILGLTMAAVKGSDVNILGGSLNQSINIHNTIRDAWESKNAPSYLVQDESATRIKLKNGAVIQPLTASQKTVRGPHPPTLLLDEIDEMDQAIFDAAKGQPMPQKNRMTGDWIEAQTAMSSTWQYPDKTFANEYQRFQEEGLPIYTWCYRETMNPIDGWLKPDFVEQKRREIPAEMWRVEYELGEPSIGTRAFDSEAVERMFSLSATSLKEKVQKDYAEYQFAEYRQDREYVIGADWAKALDYTVISVYDCTYLPVQVVYWIKMRRRPYPVMIKLFNDLLEKYHAEPIHDATGLGGVVADYLDTRAKGFLMTGEKRDNMLSEYINAVEKDQVRAPRIGDFYKSHLYCSVDDVYSRAKEFHLPDEVCSMALAWHLVSRRIGPVEPVSMTSNNELNWMAKALETNALAERQKDWREGEVHNKTAEAETELNLMV